jgi:ribonuclease VapC
MTERHRVVLDASALLAYLLDEPGAAIVAEALIDGAAMSIVNLAEVLSKLADHGQAPDKVLERLTREGLVGAAIAVMSVDNHQAVEIARLRPRTRKLGLALGDRACLALAAQLGLPVLTTDRTWKGLELGLDIRVAR